MKIKHRTAASTFISTFLLLNNGVAVASDEMNTAQIVEKIGPAVALILTESSYSGESSQGSGILIDDLRTIVTNVHVVEGAKEVKILFPDGQEFLVNGYVSADENRDLVMIRLPKNVKGISPVPLKIDNAIDQD